MKAENSEILKSLHAQRTTRSTTSALFHHLDLIRDAWEVGNFGVPGVVEALRLAGATQGVSTSNVQGFIKRCQKSGLLGARGSRRQEFEKMLNESRTQGGETSQKNRRVNGNPPRKSGINQKTLPTSPPTVASVQRNPQICLTPDQDNMRKTMFPASTADSLQIGPAPTASQEHLDEL